MRLIWHQDTEILLGDIKEPETLQAIARRTKVIIALAGPYQVRTLRVAGEVQAPGGTGS